MYEPFTPAAPIGAADACIKPPSQGATICHSAPRLLHRTERRPKSIEIQAITQDTAKIGHSSLIFEV